ncbi:hypothetical protein LPJ70_000070 [Coemansia sp. RSA 2708]|nr:hypothetical protein LPJ70_000070 [Coemansia sp. RSA 2708]
MEHANQLARQAAEFEEQQDWEQAAAMHDEAAKAYRGIDMFAFDPVATLTLSSLGNRHMRWAESCRREVDRYNGQSANDARASIAAAHGSNEQAPVAQVPEVSSDPNHSQNEHSERSEREFEDFWQYMQNWLADPAAFTRPSVTPGGMRGGPGGWGVEASPSAQNIMESFYLVGSNPDQSVSIHTTAATTPKAASPLHAINEEDEEALETPASDDKLVAENQRLMRLAQCLNERIRTLESAAHENSMLKSSIFNFREEFHRHANAVSLPRFHESGPSSRRDHRLAADSAASTAQIRQLEAEVQRLELENAKQVSISAKRKRQQQEQLMSDRMQNPNT